jgi:hypothetical protein
MEYGTLAGRITSCVSRDTERREYEGQHWTKVTDSRSPSGCGQMRLHAVALTRIGHAYQFIETRLAGRIRVDLLGFECYGRFSQINNAVGCGREHTVKFIFA